MAKKSQTREKLEQLTRMRTFDDGRSVDDVAETESADEVLIQFCQRNTGHVEHRP